MSELVKEGDLRSPGVYRRGFESHSTHRSSDALLGSLNAANAVYFHSEPDSSSQRLGMHELEA